MTGDHARARRPVRSPLGRRADPPVLPSRDPHERGHLWAYLNWALGLQRLGCEVVWLEQAPDTPAEPREPVRAELFLRKDDAVGYWEGEPEPR